MTDESHLSGANPINTHFPRQFGKFENLHSSHFPQLLSLIMNVYPLVDVRVYTYIWVSSSVINNCIVNL